MADLSRKALHSCVDITYTYVVKPCFFYWLLEEILSNYARYQAQ